MAKVITMGELLLRLSPPGNIRFFEATDLQVHYGGAEANVAASLAQLGHDVTFLTKLPVNPIGDAAIGSLRKVGINCTHIARGGERLGIYFLENGASIRPSSVIYDRKYSSITMANPEDFDFDAIFQNVDLFHVSGITPCLSDSAYMLTIAALKSAKSHNVTVSFDLNYRAKLWTENIQQKQERMADMMQYVDICFGNARDAAKCLGYSEPNMDFINGDYAVCIEERHMHNVLHTYQFQYLVTTLRDSISASDNGWSGVVCNTTSQYKGKNYHLHIVDRVGGGDAFASGFLHGLLSGMKMEMALEFALAAAAIKHTIPGDFNYLSESEVLTLMNSDGSGRVQR